MINEIRSIEYSLMTLPVRIGQSQPYEFLLDTGSQITIVEPSLAAELGLKSQGPIQVTAVSSESKAVWTKAETVEVGDSEGQLMRMVVEDLKQFKALDPSIRGVLGESTVYRQFFSLGLNSLLVRHVQGEHRAVCMS